jgi:hypothetical protein
MKKKPSSTKRWAYIEVTGTRSFKISNMFYSKEFSVVNKQYESIFVNLITLKVSNSSYNMPFYAEVLVTEHDHHLYIECWYRQKDDMQAIGSIGSSPKQAKQRRFEAAIIDED